MTETWCGKPIDELTREEAVDALRCSLRFIQRAHELDSKIAALADVRGGIDRSSQVWWRNPMNRA